MHYHQGSTQCSLTYTTPAGTQEDGFATSQREESHQRSHRNKKKQRGVDVHIVLHGLDPQLICAVRPPLQSAVSLQCAPSGRYNLRKTRRELTQIKC